MRREIRTIKGHVVSGCCPGHDDYPNDSYSNRRSKKARSRDKAREHRTARRIIGQKMKDGDFEVGIR